MSAPGIRPPTFRLPAETCVGLVRLQVSDLVRSTEFYSNLLGFTVLENDGGHALLAARGETHALVELRSGAEGPLRTRRLGLYHFAILLPTRADLARFLDHALRSGVEPGAADHLVSEALYLQDPDGLGIEVYRDRYRSDWRVRGDELQMASAPLDLRALLEAREGLSWQGMPAGTTIGHVHLHVGDLEAAKRFYHAGLGLDLVVWSYPQALFLSAGGYHHHLGLNTWAGPRAVAAGQNEPRLIDWELVLPDVTSVEAAAASLKGLGHAVTPREADGSVTADPWGTGLRLSTHG